MVRPYPKQRKILPKAGHRQTLVGRYHPPLFNRRRSRVFYAVDSEMGYQLAKGLYWAERYHAINVSEYSGWAIQGVITNE